jgi:hypothetical protein
MDDSPFTFCRVTPVVTLAASEPPTYSARSATIGSTFIARRAGSQHASTPLLTASPVNERGIDTASFQLPAAALRLPPAMEPLFPAYGGQRRSVDKFE